MFKMSGNVPKWSPRREHLNIINLPTVLPPGLRPPQIQAILLRARLSEIQYRLEHLNDYSDAQSVLDFDDKLSRETSSINAKSVKAGTSFIKARDLLYQERKLILESIDRLYPAFRAPGAYRIGYTKCTKKFFIPDPHLIGQIIGPRGETLQQLESMFNAKISIRGIGSTPDSKGEIYATRSPDEPLHALIEAYNEQSIEDVVKILEGIIAPKPDKENELKKAQLRQLAVYNGIIPATPQQQQPQILQQPVKPKLEEIPPWFDKTLNIKNVEVETAIDDLLDQNAGVQTQKPLSQIKWEEKMSRLCIDLKSNDISKILPTRLPPGSE